MVAFLNWSKSVVVGTLNTIAKVAFFIILLIIVFSVVGMLRGDGLPDKIVLTADLRPQMADSSRPSSFGVSRPLTIMDLVFALDRASRDSRVKGLYLRVGMAASRLRRLRKSMRPFTGSGKAGGS